MTLEIDAAIDDGGDTAMTALARVQDSDHEGLTASFGYLVEPTDKAIRIALRSIHIDASDAEPGRRLTVTDVRDLPLTRWESAARARITADLQRKLSEMFDAIKSVDPKEVIADLRIKQLYPDALTAVGASAERRLDGLRRLALTSVEYQTLLADGRADPAAEIARMHQVTPSTARSWIHRARKAGFLGPAVSRTPGEDPGV